MKSPALKSDLLLLLTAAIWGFAFVAQRIGMDFIGPFTYNAVRFALGSLSLIPLLIYFRKKTEKIPKKTDDSNSYKTILIGAGIGLVLFAGASFQQAGLVYTTAGKAAFITGLYVVIVPILLLFMRQNSTVAMWAGALLAAVGLYFLSITEELTIEFGDLLEIIGAVFWAIHVLLVGWFSKKVSPIYLAFLQFAFCSLFSFITAFSIEVVTIQGIQSAAMPILYGGLGSVGIAYTLQVVAQRNAHPAHAAIILSLETVFAAIGGWLVLNEILSTRSQIGCILMFTGMIISQLRKRSKA